MKQLVTALLLLMLFGAPALHADVTLESFTFGDVTGEKRFKALIEELRCLVCQNQSLADSDAELAHDLRAEVYEMMQAGRSDDEIVEFLVARYGDFVLYSPPVKPSTYFLWYGPFVLLIIAAVLLVRAVYRQRRTPEAELSREDEQRLQQILGKSAENDEEQNR